MEKLTSRVYVLTDESGRVLRCEGGYTMSNIDDVSKWTLIDQGVGDRYNLCQSHYLPGGLYTEEGIPRYKLEGGRAVPRAQEEMEGDRSPAQEPSPTVEERVTALEEDSAATREALEMILLGVTADE